MFNGCGIVSVVAGLVTAAAATTTCIKSTSSIPANHRWKKQKKNKIWSNANQTEMVYTLLCNAAILYDMASTSHRSRLNFAPCMHTFVSCVHAHRMVIIYVLECLNGYGMDAPAVQSIACHSETDLTLAPPHFACFFYYFILNIHNIYYWLFPAPAWASNQLNGNTMRFLLKQLHPTLCCFV